MDIDFETAAKKIKQLTTPVIHPTDEELLEIYGLYKQALHGNNTTSKPGFWNPTAKAKWDAWYAEKGYTNNEAKELYVKKVMFLLGKYTIR